MLDGPRLLEPSRSLLVSPVHRSLAVLGLGIIAAASAQPAWAGLEEAVKAMQAGDLAAAEKDLQVLVKERDPRAQFLLGLYVYGNPDSKMFDLNKAAPLLLDASERGYIPAMIPLAGAYAEGKGSAQELLRILQVAGRRRALEFAELRRTARAGRSRAHAGGTREGQGRSHGLHFQDQMTSARVALLAALLVAAATVRAQPNDASDVAPALRAAVVAYRAGDFATAESRLRALAATNADAEAWLGAVLLDRGRTAEALQFLQRAANAGSAEGAHRLALVFAEGIGGTPRDDAKALALFEKAAAAGHHRAQINVGTLYFRGQGTPRDLVRARAWLEKAAAQEDPYALYALGRAMDESEGQAMADPVRAADLYRRAAQLGHPIAALRYGLALSEGLGVRKNPTQAQQWLAYADKWGVPEAALAMGDMAARTPASRDKAANEKAVRAAITWYEAAAQAGVPSAQFKLANAYFAGVGVARDPQQALRWYQRAAAQGQPEAEHALGIFLTGGLAGPPDAVEGYKWLLLADRAGMPDSKGVRQKAAEKTSAADRNRAEALASGFVAQPERPLNEGLPRLGPPAKF